MIYLDYAATTPLDPEVLEAMNPWLTIEYANPSAIYQSAQKARAAIDDARGKVAQFLHASRTEVFFTSSGTESCNWALRGIIEAQRLKNPTGKIHIIGSSIEHSAVMKPLRHFEKLYGISVSFIPVDSEGIVRIEELKKSIRPETILVSIMMVNNEIGTLQPVEDIGHICRERGILFHTDACQAAGYFNLDVTKIQCDLLSLNAGKIYGPKGVGALYIKEGTDISPLIHGGGQEFKRRAGTENVAGIVGMGKAVELLMKHPEHREGVKKFRDSLWKNVQNSIPGIKLNGSLTKRSPNNLHVFIPGIEGDTLVRKLDLEGIAVSTTSACSAGILDPSHVLLALGGGVAKGSIRITLGKYTTELEIDTFIRTLKKVL